MQALADAEAAREADNVKTIFLAKVSHELRTPVQNILGYCELSLRAMPTPLLANLVKDYPQLSALHFEAGEKGACYHALYKKDPTTGLSIANDSASLTKNGLAAYLIEAPAGAQALVSFEPLNWPDGVCPEPYLTRILGQVFPYGEKILPNKSADGVPPPQTLLITFTGFGRISLQSPSEASSIDLRRYATAADKITIAVCLRQVAGGKAVIRRVGVLNAPTVDVTDPVLIPADPVAVLAKKGK